MHGLVAALGSAACHLTRDTVAHLLGAPAAEAFHHPVNETGMSLGLLVPPDSSAMPPMASSPRRSLRLAVSGYLLVDSPQPANRHLQLLLEAVERHGLEAALRSVVAGKKIGRASCRERVSRYV